jgi:hypothetical protein
VSRISVRRGLRGSRDEVYQRYQEFKTLTDFAAL